MNKKEFQGLTLSRAELNIRAAEGLDEEVTEQAAKAAESCADQEARTKQLEELLLKAARIKSKGD